MVPFSASRPAGYHSLVLFLPGSPQLPAGGRSRRASSSALCLWLLALRPACGRSPTSVSWGVGACVHVGVCVCVCVCTPTYWDEPHPKTASGDDKHMGQEVHSVVAAVTEHVLPSMGPWGATASLRPTLRVLLQAGIAPLYRWPPGLGQGPTW